MWYCIVEIVWVKTVRGGSGPLVDSWSILPNGNTDGIGWANEVDPNHGFPAASWLFIFAIYIVIQGGMTIGLHCSEVIANVVRDEMIWRRATSEAGTKPITNPILAVFMNWPSVGLLIAKPVLRE